MASPSLNARPDLRRSIARIAQYRPFGSGEIQSEFARREFILAAAHENGGTFGSLAECRDVCQALWGLDLDTDELREAVRRLIKTGYLVRSDGGYRLTKGAREGLTARVRTSSATEAQAFAEWEISVRDLAPDLAGDELGELRDDLTDWLHEIIARHGMEAALLLSPEQDRARQLFEEIEALGFDFLPDRDARLMALRPKALYAFIRRPTVAQRTFLANLMTTAYMVAVFTLDPAAHEVVQSITRGQRIYLDTNVVYAILNLSGPTAFLSARRVLDLSRSVGYEICVTPWTVAEMKYSVRRARQKLARTTLPPRALAELAADAAGDETFVTAYWRKYKETGVSASDFLDLHEQIEPLLEQANIAVVADGCIAVERDQDGIAEQIGLLETVPGGSSKPEPIQEHDVKHRMLVERLRGSGNRRFSNAGCWFITRDSVLTPYAAARRESPDILPFAVSLTAWAHVVRSLCPRTKDYEQTLVDLLDTPSVRPRGVVSYATVSDVLGRIDMLVEDSTEEIATRMLLDSALMEEVEAAEGSARDRFIESAIEEKQHEMERQLRETQAAVAFERTAREEAELHAATTEAELQQERETRAEAERSARRLDEELDARGAEAEQKLAAADRKAAELQRIRVRESEKHAASVAELEARVSRQERLARTALAVFCLALTATTIGVPIAAGWISDGWWLVADLGAGAVLMLAAIAFEFGWRTAAKVAAIAATAIGAVAALQQLVASDDDSHPPATPQQPDSPSE